MKGRAATPLRAAFATTASGPVQSVSPAAGLGSIPAQKISKRSVPTLASPMRS